MKLVRGQPNKERCGDKRRDQHGVSIPAPSIYAFAPDYVAPYTQQYSFGTEYQLAKDLSVNVTYLGVRGTLLTILRNGNASTLDIVNGVKKLMPGIQASAPPGMKIGLLFDQSTFVSRAIDSVLHEGAIAATTACRPASGRTTCSAR